MTQLPGTPNQLHVSRRQFIGLVWAGALALTAAEGVAALLRFLAPRVSPGAFGTRINAGKIDDFQVGSITYFSAARFYLARLDNGFLALYRKCTHLGCVVPWVEAEHRFNCPCHASIFNKRGEVLAGPAPRPLDLFPVQLENGEVWVDTSQIVSREKFDEAQVTRV
ncbi:MAG: Rieske 2Fe-2S domain-containing protein [Chloroflexi bacterium]|nr:Rieske 2Fe-2S domain-containing protein [Chloroflexota bacterium]